MPGKTEAANRLYDDLKREGLSPWLNERDILPGQKWENEIEKALKRSRYFIPLFSFRSMEKKDIYTKKSRISS